MAAIYMWFEGAEAIFTTTPYPVEIQDGMTFGISLEGGYLHGINFEAYSMDIETRDGNVIDILLSSTELQDAYELSVETLAGNVLLILLTTPTLTDAYDMSIETRDGEVRDALVPGWMPDEGIHFGCTLINGTMTAV